MKQRKPRNFLKRLAVTVLAVVALLLLFVVAFVFNPLEGDLRDVRDLVPREVDFFLRKTDLERDFAGGDLELVHGRLPQPAFWSDLSGTRGWPEIERGPLLGGLRREHAAALQEAVDGLAELERQSGGFVDLARDLIGEEVVVAGYFEDRTGAAPRPLAQPWWCLYTRVSWRVRAAWGLANWAMIQDRARAGGVDMSTEGDLLVVKAPGLREPLYVARELDCLMVANSRHIVEQSRRLAAGVEGEEPFGQAAKYTDGVVKPLVRWVDDADPDHVNAFEYSLTTNTMDGFRRFAATWPDAQNRDSMNERVLASFLNLKGWNSLSGALMFEPGRLSLLGEVVLNSHMHSEFQTSFYRSEGQQREKWLDPFLRMVPDSACAAAALRMPVEEFLHAMLDALLPEERQLLDENLRKCRFMDQELANTRDLIDRMKVAFLPRSGFVFRRNLPDPEIPVAALSPVPQIAWVFWLRDGCAPIAEALVQMLQKHAAVFRFGPVYHLPLPGLPEPVTEFTNPAIPGTGEIATIVFHDFFVVSNSGPLVKDLLRTQYGHGASRSVLATAEYQRITRELPQSVNGFVWLRGHNLLPVLDDYREASVASNREPDPEWLTQQRGRAEEVVRREQFPQYQSKAAIPAHVLQGPFETAVRKYLKDLWENSSGGLSTADLPAIDQMRGVAQMIDHAFLELQLENNYIRFLGKLVLDLR